jgi:pimeloyl-[acyl-carrier protein] synthase
MTTDTSIAGAPLSSFDFNSPEYVQDPYEYFRAWQDEAPVWWSDSLEGWVTSRYEDVRGILRDHGAFPQSVFYERANGDSLGRDVWTDLNPPEHTEARAAARDFVQYFRPRRLDAAVRPLIEQRVEQVLTALDSPAPVEVFAGVVAPIVANVIADIVGIDGPETVKLHMDAVHTYLKMARVRRATDEIRSAGKRGGQAVIDELESRCPVKAQDDSGEDLLTILGHGSMSSEDIVLAAAQTLFAGMETTQRGVTNAVFALLSHSEALAAVQADPMKLVPTTFEETLRWLTPVSIKARDVGADIEMHGQQLRQGQTMYVLLGAANRDPRQFENPEMFDISRSQIDHLGFGAGVHLCVGAPLARVISDVLLKNLVANYPRISLVDPNTPVQFEGPVYRGPRQVHVALNG